MNIERLQDLPPEWPAELTSSIRNSLVDSGRTIVVLDDDPTGTQTVYDVPVLTRFDGGRLVKALEDGPPLLFLLTNSRALTFDETQSLHRELAINLKDAAAKANRHVELISRSDSTLRGHFPIETDTLALHWPEQSDITLLMPFFLEGGRLTIDGQHFVQEGDQLIPAHETPFANDAVFGFKHSYLPEYVEEKTSGRIPAAEVISIPIEVIRRQGPTGVQQIFDAAPAGSVCVADGVTDKDAQVVAAAVGNTQRSIMARVAASYVRARAGLENRPLLAAENMQGEGHGGLVVVGSHVPKTTIQLNALLEQHPDCLAVELPVAKLIEAMDDVVDDAIAQVSEGLNAGQDVVLFTSRGLVSGTDDRDNLRISKSVSQSLVNVVRQLDVRPRYLVAKGGITSSDIATQGLGVELAMVAGSILPGVPVWRLGPESRFPGMYYVIFPGNVGGDDALALVISKLK